MTGLAELRSVRAALSPAARALRLQRIVFRLQEGASDKDIAAKEGLSRKRLRQIVGTRTGQTPQGEAGNGNASLMIMQKIPSYCSNSLKMLKTAIGRPCNKLAWICVWRLILLESAPRFLGRRLSRRAVRLDRRQFGRQPLGLEWRLRTEAG